MKKQNKTKEKKTKATGRKRNYTYVEAHNRAFWAFNKAARIMIWAGVLNVVGLMIAIMQEAFGGTIDQMVFVENSYLFNTVHQSGYQYSLCFSTNALIFRLIESAAFNVFNGEMMSETWFVIIIVVIAIITAAIAVYVGVLASQGKKIALYSQTIFYIVDTGAILANYFIGEHPNVIWIEFALHIVILFFVAVSIYQYYHLFEIEKIYKKQKSNIVNDSVDIDKIKKGESKDGTNE